VIDDVPDVDIVTVYAKDPLAAYRTSKARAVEASGHSTPGCGIFVGKLFKEPLGRMGQGKLDIMVSQYHDQLTVGLGIKILQC